MDAKHKFPQPTPMTPQDFGLPSGKPFAIVKLQTVETIPVYPDSKSDNSIGRAIDSMLEESRKHGCIPNRISIDLNPKSADPADVESF